MCQFLTAVLPAGADLDRAARSLAPAGMTCRPLDNPNVVGLEPGEIWALATAGHCDCGTPVGQGTGEQRSDVTENDLRKLRRKGWSDAKIDRWLAEKEKVRSKVERSTPRGQLEPIVEALKSAAPLGLVLHTYRGRIDQERITIARRRVVHAPDLTTDDLHDLAEDTLLYVKR